MEPVITITVHEAGQIYSALSPSGLARLTPDLKKKLTKPGDYVQVLPQLATEEKPPA